jgi:membrane-bound ClpP family serine protease
VVVSGTYHSVEAAPVGLFDALVAMPRGMIEAAEVIFLVFLIGGAFTVVDQTGVLRRGVTWLVGALGDQTILVIPIVCLLFATGGALENMQEEIIALIPVLLILTNRLGYKPMVAVAMSVGAANVGSAFSPINPFQVGIAQKLAQLPLLSGGGFRLIFLATALSIWITFVMRMAKKTAGEPVLSDDDLVDQSFIPKDGVVLALVVLTLFTLFHGIYKGQAANEDGGKIYYTLLKGTINNKLADDFEGVLEEAEKAKARALILEIDTYGGRLDAAVRIKDKLVDTKIDTIAFVNKKAISAGALISLATKHIVMAPGSTIGAATPVKLTYWDEKPASEKVKSYFRKEMKTTAESGNHPGNIAAAMVDSDLQIAGVVEKGKLLTLTTKEAIRLNLAEYEVKDLGELYRKFQLEGVTIENRPIPWTEKVVELMPDQKTIFHPVLLWFLLGLTLIFLEFVVPGVILVFFGIGAWAVTVTTHFGLTTSFQSQLLIFAVTSILLLVVLRKWIKGKFYGHVGDVQDQTKNLDEFTGQSVVVLEEVIPNKMEGAVEFKGAKWRAVSDEHLKNGEIAIITSVDGITFRVRKKEEG